MDRSLATRPIVAGSIAIASTVIGVVMMSPSRANAEEEVTVAEIAIFRTPGKPMQLFDAARPAEEVVARRTGKRFEVVARVNVPRDGITAFTERTAALSQAEWDRLEELVGQQRILGWTPGSGDGKAVVDYGAAGFRVLEVDGRTLTKGEWTGPVPDAERWTALASALASLARTKIPELKLFYVP